MREVRIFTSCDQCRVTADKSVESTGSIAFVIGGEARRFDHCKTHADPRWSELNTYAQPDEDALDRGQGPGPRRPGRPPQPNRPGDKLPFQCPWCGVELVGRTNAIRHATVTHGVDEVAASQRVKPHGDYETTNCAVCGYLTVEGTGYSAHVIANHGRDAWEKIKADQERGKR